jgi:cell division protein FtsQ
MSIGFKKIIAASLLASMLTGGVCLTNILSDPAVFPINRVKVEGDVKYVSQSMLSAALQKNLSQSFFSVDIQNIRQQVKSVPWVHDVVVRRVWPDAIVLDIKEQIPVAVWNNQSLINRDASQFDVSDLVKFSTLPALNSVAGFEAQVVEKYFALQAMMTSSELLIREITLDDSLFWSVTLANGIEIKLSDSTTDTTVMQFVNAFQKNQILNRSTISTVDLRYHNGFSVSWSLGV